MNKRGRSSVTAADGSRSNFQKTSGEKKSLLDDTVAAPSELHKEGFHRSQHDKAFTQ